jgi:lipoprotein-anchoring transpeptidase ErfK/SrfK
MIANGARGWDGAPMIALARLPLIAAALATSAVAAAQSLAGNPALDAAAATLRPGQFVLDDDRPMPGFDAMGFPTPAPTTIAISIAMQRLYVYRGNELVAVSTVSTGRAGHRTPPGTFTILQKARWHRSNLYSNAPMPFMQRLTWDGVAIHAGQLPGFPASHGCIRVPLSFAQALFGMTALGDEVSIDDWPPHTPVYLDVDWVGVTGAARAVIPALSGRSPVLEYDFRSIVPAT